MIPKMPAPAKAGVADFSDKIMRKIKEKRERCRFNLIEKRSTGGKLASAPDIPIVRRRNRQEPVAQVVEHLTFNQVVVGSSPTGLTK
jgi:hypothetical protein